MKSFVSKIAIKSWYELLFKVPLFGVFIGTMIMTLENLLMPPEDIQTFWELLPMIIAGTCVLSCVIFPIVTHQYRLQQELSQMALTDHLTGLPNRRAFLGRLAERLDDGAKGHLLLVDADHFKRVNDKYGHGFGDACLKAISDRLRNVAGPNCFYGRIGGEEFTMFIEDYSASRRDVVASRLTAPLTVDHQDQDNPLQVTITLSVGAAEATDSIPLETLLHQADVALYAAKTAGRARMVDWIPALERAS